jgi:hypothetical protein
MMIALALTLFAQTEIRNHSTWKDTEGSLIDCHEGHLLRIGKTFYWYGRAYQGNTDGVFGEKGARFRCGLTCYSSTDLVSWTNRGVILAYPDSGWLTKGTWHRPRVLFNAATGTYVLWFFMFPDTTPGYFSAVVATSTAPSGPFTVRTGPGFRVSGDLALFQDRDGAGYLCYEVKRRILVSRLTDDFLNITGEPVVAMQEGGNHEGSSMIFYKGKYIVAGSGVEGLDPTETFYAVADHPMGPYTYKGLMSEQKTWRSQISAFVYLEESDRLFAMCEQWLIGPTGSRVPGEQSCQLWLPVTFNPATGAAKLTHVEKWNPWAKAP